MLVFKKSGFLWKERRYSKFYGKNGKKRSNKVGIDYFHGKNNSLDSGIVGIVYLKNSAQMTFVLMFVNNFEIIAVKKL